MKKNIASDGSDDYILVKGLTKDYGRKRGVFDINLSIARGEVFGLVGVNGSGKTTIIRHMMGFLKADKGEAFIAGMNCWKESAVLKRRIGYIPGEIAFPSAATGMDFLKRQAGFLGMTDLSCAKKLIERFQLSPEADLKRMSKGMKQKTAIAAAFMSDPEILLLDEATTGLDPLMQDEFIKLIKEEKRRGKTVFMSSHMFDELENTCDKVAFLKDGHIIDEVNMAQLRGNEKTKKYKIEFCRKEDFSAFLKSGFKIERIQEQFCQATVSISDKDINLLFNALKNRNVKFITQIPYTLEAYFKNKYRNTEAI